MKSPSFYIAFGVAVCLALTAPCLWAQDGLEGALPRVSLASSLNLIAPFQHALAVADFDNDHKPDGAVLVRSGHRTAGQSSFRIEFHLSGSANTTISFESTETAVAIAAVDVNHDGAADVVIEQPLTHKRLCVWLGDGHGGFHKARVEDLPSYSNTSAQFDSADLPPSSPVHCLASRCGIDAAEQAAQLVADLPPPMRDSEASSASCLPASPALSLNSSRAPPFSVH